MSVIDIVTTVAGGVFSGGATGLIGVLLQRWFDHKKQQSDLELVRINLEAARATRELELAAQERMAKLSADSQERIADMNAQARAQESADALMTASYGNDKAAYLPPEAVVKSRVATWLMALVDFSRGMIRPGSTAYLLVLTTMLWMWCKELGDRKGVAFSAEQVLQIQLQIIGTVTYLCTTTVTWWFGIRTQQKR